MSDLISQFEDIKENNNSINAYITFSDLQKNQLITDGKLSGKTIAIKDTISTLGLRTTCASKMLENYVPPFDAHVVTLLKKHGAIIARIVQQSSNIKTNHTTSWQIMQNHKQIIGKK